MSTKVVYSIRIPEEIKRMMEELSDVDWQKEIRMEIERIVRKKMKEKLLREAEDLRKKMRVSVSAAKLIREDRDAR